MKVWGIDFDRGEPLSQLSGDFGPAYVPFRVGALAPLQQRLEPVLGLFVEG